MKIWIIQTDLFSLELFLLNVHLLQPLTGVYDIIRANLITLKKHLPLANFKSQTAFYWNNWKKSQKENWKKLALSSSLVPRWID